MDEAVRLLYTLFLDNQPAIVISCNRYNNIVEIKLLLWKNTKPYTIILKPR